MFKFLFSIFTFILFISSVNGQSPLKIGDWQAHYSYIQGEYVSQNENFVYFGNKNQGILKVNKASGERTQLSTVDGLATTGMRLLKYDVYNQLLIATYFDGNIDLIKDDGAITNIPFIATSIVQGDKTIHEITVTSDTTAYMAMGFGLKVLNIRDQEFGSETRAGLPFYQIAIHDNKIYATTDEGIYFVDKDNFNIQDFSNWSLLNGEGFPSDYSSKSIMNYNGILHFNINDTIFQYDGQNLTNLYHQDGFSVKYMTAEGPHLLVGMYCGDSCNDDLVFFNESGFVRQLNGTNCVNKTNYAVEDTNGNVYLGDNWEGYRILNAGQNTCDIFDDNSPYDMRCGSLELSNGELWVTSEVIAPAELSFTEKGFYQYADGKWTNYNRFRFPILFGDGKAVYRLAVSPDTTKVYLGTRWNTGLLEYDRINDQLIGIPNAEALLKPSADPNRHRVTGLEFDSEGNLWIANHTDASKGLIVLKKDGSFSDNFKTLASRSTRVMLIDDYGYIWLGTDDQGINIYDTNGTIDDPSDDRVRNINNNTSVLESNRILSIAKDLDGGIWVGTDDGAVVFECQGDPFNDNCTGSRPRVVVNGITALLLEEVRVNAIDVDAANRKWFGTTSGIFVQSPDGSERVATYDESNSPLFSDIINDIAIDRDKGIVYVATGKGIISLKIDATGVSNVHLPSSKILAYPNPVRPDYDGPISIKGFARDANIKITDSNGQLVYETTALGGQVIWNGKDYNGRKVSSGVYLIYATRTSNINNPTAVVAKILFLN